MMSSYWFVEVKDGDDNWRELFGINDEYFENDFTMMLVNDEDVETIKSEKGKEIRVKNISITDSDLPEYYFGYNMPHWELKRNVVIPIGGKDNITKFQENIRKA